MKDILTLDINELVSNEIHEKIDGLERTIKVQADKIDKKEAEIADLQKQIVSDRQDIVVSEALRAAYSKIDTIKHEDGSTTSCDDLQYAFIEKCMGLVYGRKPVYKNFRNGERYGRAAVQFHPWKDELMTILQVLEPLSLRRFEFIPAFKMPFEWDADMIEKWASNPPYSTNGSMFDMTYWTCGTVNAPYPLVMASPHFSDDRVFSAVLKAIKECKGESDYLFRLPEYNTTITPDHIREMASVAIKVLPKKTGHSNVHKFLSRNMGALGDDHISSLMQYSHHENQFRDYFWLNFPEKYQWEYLLDRVGNFEGIKKALSDHACKWTSEREEALWQEFFRRKLSMVSA